MAPRTNCFGQYSKLKVLGELDVKVWGWQPPQGFVRVVEAMKGNTIAKERYLELTALFIDREIAKFRRGEQAARVSFTNVAKLARNASKELVGPGTSARVQRPDACPRADRVGAACGPADDERGPCMGGPPRSDIDRFLGHRIKQLRLLACMSQQQVARQLGVSSQQVHKYEKGISRFSAGRLLAIARVFNVAVADLFDGYGSGAPLGPAS